MRNVLIILFIAILSISYAQGQEEALAKVHYKFFHINDTTKRDQPLRDDVVTYLGKSSSYYSTYSDETIKQDIAAQKLVADFTRHLKISFSTTPIKEFYLLDAKNKSLKKVEAIASSFDAYMHDEPWEEQNWEVMNESKEIGGYICQKAVAKFKGRKYEAWFTTELPFPFGPWKLHGLPGLILSAQDEKGDVKFEFNGFDKIEKNLDVRVEIPFHVIKASPYDIEKLRQVFQSDQQSKYYENLQSSGRLAIGTDYFGIDYSKHIIDMSFDDDYKPSFTTNNPMELAK